MDLDDTSQIDWNAQSLFTTPMGQIVQQSITEMYIKKYDKTSEYYEYMQEVNEAISNLSQSFWDIDLTIKLIKFSHPKIKFFKMTKVDRGDYIKYHFENYFFRLPKLKDQVLQLLNIVFRMKLSQSKGLEKKVIAHQCVQDKKLDIFLNYFEEAFSKIRPLRDTIAHRSDLTDANMSMLTSYQLVPYNREQYELRLCMMISYTYIFEKNQCLFKQAVIILLLALEEDFNLIVNTLAKIPIVVSS